MTSAPRAPGLAARLEAYGAAHPEVILIAPYVIYVLLLGLPGLLPAVLEPVAHLTRGVLALLAVWAFRRHLPPWGRPHWLLATTCGVLCALGWVWGQYFFDSVGLGGRLPGFPGEKVVVDPRMALGADKLFELSWFAKFIVAWTAVPVVEELFWRAFLLRAMVDWQRFDRVPLGSFTWLSFLGTSLLSVGQHPDNWMISIFCWFAFNALFYWKRSLLFITIVHGVTNFALYILARSVGDWSF